MDSRIRQGEGMNSYLFCFCSFLIYVTVVHNSATVCTRTVQTGMFQEVEQNPHADWGTILSNYTRCFKQLESLADDIDPLFYLNEVIPTEVTENPALIPYLLSSQVEKKSINANANAKLESKINTQPNDAELTSSLQIYNSRLDELISNLPNRRKIDD